jgi:serine/threonine protein kinase
MPKAGRYHIARKLADGGMAEIFLGTQHGAEGFERPVVLKRILAPLVADPQFRNMLIDEAHVAMGLNHSNIVQVLDLGHVQGRYFLVMEFVDGWDLGQIVTRANNAEFSLPPEIILYIAAEICRALAYAHSRTRDGQPLALVHRDVSPQNVLVSEQGEVKLTDFGIAKAMGRRERTHQGVIKGKLAFMSPEQASGSELDNRSDLFSLGTVLYLLITGRRPFDAPTDMESIVRVRECRFQPPEEAKPGLHPEMVAIIRRAMQVKPADRFQSADDMLLAIENVQRTVYKPAGQTELKRWLADLYERDHMPSFGRAQTARPLPSLDELLDVGEGADLVFDESDVLEISEIMRGMGATVAAPPPLPPPSAPPPLPAEPAIEAKTSVATPMAKQAVAGRSKSRAVVALILFIAVAAAAWLIFGGRAPELTKHAPRKAAVPTRPARAKPAPKPAVAADNRPASMPVVAVDASPAAAPTDDQTSPLPSAVAQDEEEDLLKNAEPESSDQVIGEDEGIVRHTTRKAPVVGAEPPAAVSVRIASSPEGAVVKVGKRVFGRAPINLRFRPGTSYDVTFVKKGYQTRTKRIMVTTRANQSVKAGLRPIRAAKPKPAPKRGFFRRLFGK